MIAAILASAAPLLLAALGTLLTEVSGLFAISAEGFMNLGSFLGWSLARATGSLFLGAVLASIIAGLLGGLLASWIHRTRSNPFIAALALNLAAPAICDALESAFFGTRGALSDPSVAAPGAFLGLGPFAWIALCLLPCVRFLIQRTRFGLRLRASSSSAIVMADRGLSRERYQTLAWIMAAALAALAGVALSFRVGAYAPGAVAGRGWIAIAVVYLGFRRVWGLGLAAVFFAAAEQLGNLAQGALSAAISLALPSLLALVFFVVGSLYSSRSSLRNH